MRSLSSITYETNRAERKNYKNIRLNYKVMVEYSFNILGRILTTFHI